MIQTGAEVSKQLESIKQLLWHGNTEEALERLVNLLMDLSLIRAHSVAAEKVADGLTNRTKVLRFARDGAAASDGVERSASGRRGEEASEHHVPMVFAPGQQNCNPNSFSSPSNGQITAIEPNASGTL